MIVSGNSSHSFFLRFANRRNWALLLLLVMAFPAKAVSLVAIVIYFFLALPYLKNNSGLIFLILGLFLYNSLTTIILHGFNFLGNNLLFFIFVSPIILFIIDDDHNEWSHRDFRWIVERFLVIQIIFSLANILSSFLNKFSFDIDSGDVVAGTLRLPFVYKPDASNVIFSFMLILVLSIYLGVEGKKANRYIVSSSLIIFFIASVNHLILASLISSTIVMFRKNLIKLVLLIAITLLGYKYLQPVNFNIVLFRLSSFFEAIFRSGTVNDLSLKGAYISGLLGDICQNPWMLVTGLGGGTYSSRAAFFFTGDYVSSFPFKNITSYMFHNSYQLWLVLKNAPSWLAGSFNYPYGSFYSFLSEFGLISSSIFIILFYKRLYSKGLPNAFIIFISIFIFMAALVDNYLEYFQAFFIFYFLLKIAPLPKDES